MNAAAPLLDLNLLAYSRFFEYWMDIAFVASIPILGVGSQATTKNWVVTKMEKNFCIFLHGSIVFLLATLHASPMPH